MRAFFMALGLSIQLIISTTFSYDFENTHLGLLPLKM